ncbi:tetratricopeptide repeat-containing S1 family peptidase [Kamptonema formosum]|uniref:tetratricopeptide repeat-containing S1 family peptidase n=1 Tax=Kamptonema formosum TaxID=331992 RepID=UPI00034B0EF6|nr:trypsin-like peptidase domain-containing protein [Oscillatoria sp. PCC 10802]
MRFYYGLPAALIGAAIVIVQPQVAAAFNPDEAKEIAKEITVLIPETLADGKEANGSGSIIAREGNTYTVLTAYHVVCKDQNDQCQKPRNQLRAVTPDGEEYPLNFSTVRKIPGVDLAVFQFTSNKNYRVAILGNYELTGDQFIFASGWPDPKLSGDSQRKRHFNIGKVIPQEIVPLLKIFEASLGYDLLYTSITYGGMSGGPVLDTEGRVIGVHGQNEGERVDDEQSGGGKVRLPIGFSAAIPVRTFVSLAPQAGIQGSFRVETSPPTPVSLEKIGEEYYDNLDFPDPDEKNALVWANQANKMWRLGQLALAYGSYEKALEIKQNFYQAWYGKGLVLTYWKKFPEALQAYEEALKIAPNSNARQLRDKLKQYLDGTASQSQPPAPAPGTALPESSAPATTPLPAQPPQPQPVPPPQQQPPAQEPLW